MLTKEEMPACPVATTVRLIGSKWEPADHIKKSAAASVAFLSGLKKNLEGMSQKVLTDSTCVRMEADGIVTRTVYPEVPPRVECALSEPGESMRPVMDAMEKWGINYENQLQTK